jgi:hypothetical protein
VGAGGGGAVASGLGAREPTAALGDGEAAAIDRGAAAGEAAQPAARRSAAPQIPNDVTRDRCITTM